jgi:Acyl-CoA reductase (LuxC)
MLAAKEVEVFCQVIEERPIKTVAIVCAGNIPLVCFHDVLCVLLCGHRVLIKMSSDDNVLLPFILKLLVHYESGFEEKILFATGKLSDFDAIIATGSNNTSNYLNYYFSKYPHIIRKSRTSVAVLNGNETSEDLKNLGHDIFDYYGLGCRNVSKVLVPKDYSFNHFFESIVDFGSVVNNKKYGNNYDYYRSIYLLESEKFLDNNFLILKESQHLFSPVSVLFFQSFNSANEQLNYIKNNENSIQCVIGKDFIPFGYSQQPVISEFADKINTVDFLLNL